MEKVPVNEKNRPKTEIKILNVSCIPLICPFWESRWELIQKVTIHANPLAEAQR